MCQAQVPSAFGRPTLAGSLTNPGLLQSSSKFIAVAPKAHVPQFFFVPSAAFRTNDAGFASLAARLKLIDRSATFYGLIVRAARRETDADCRANIGFDRHACFVQSRAVRE